MTDHFPVLVTLKLDSAAGSVASIAVRLVALLPNPAGNENQNESITLKNTGTAPAGMSGWIVKDLAGRSWKLDALETLAAGSKKQIKRSGQPMALNNSGDTIRLINPAGDVVQKVTYGRTEEQETVLPASLSIQNSNSV